ncbi:MAG: flagellar biosynthetic protein FliO [Pseudomonadota bacterium]
MKRLIPALLLAVVPLASVAAEVSAPAATIGGGADPLSGGYLVKLTLSLLGVLALLFVLIGLMKRFGGLPRAGRQQEIAVQGSLAVGPRERVVWIEVAGHQLVLGVTSGQIEPLLHLPPDAVPARPVAPSVDPLMEAAPIGRSRGGEFDQVLAGVELRGERR